MNRHDAREAALKMIYEASFHDEDDSVLLYKNALDSLDIKENDAYLNKLFFGVLENTAELDEKIKENAVGWNFNRISKISVAIMRIAIYEMKYCDDVPTNAALNEAVELAKTYDEEKASSFVNGVLNAVAEKEGLKSE